MKRSREDVAAAGVTAIACALFAVASVYGACKPVEVIAAPDAASEERYCEPLPIAFCEAGAPTGDTCIGDPTAKSFVVKTLPTDAGYRIGCVVNLLVHTAEKDCRIGATCKCVQAPDASASVTAEWSCFP